MFNRLSPVMELLEIESSAPSSRRLKKKGHRKVVSFAESATQIWQIIQSRRRLEKNLRGIQSRDENTNKKRKEERRINSTGRVMRNTANVCEPKVQLILNKEISFEYSNKNDMFKENMKEYEKSWRGKDFKKLCPILDSKSSQAAKVIGKIK